VSIIPPSVTPLVEVERLSKRYGARVALDAVTFDVRPGAITGLLGPNGAGKSSALGVLATTLPFDGGSVRVAGHPLPRAARAARRALGLVPQRLAVYPTLTARENLRFFGRAAGLSARAAAAEAARVLALLGLADRADEPVERFSIGMRRRLNLGCGILHRPEVVLLDEPTVGVDPQSRERVFEAVQQLARDGAAVLYSTHYMEEAERLCGRVVLLDAGRVVAAGSPAELVAQTALAPRVTLHTAAPLPAGWLAGVPSAAVVSAHDGHTDVRVPDPTVVPAVVAAALRAAGGLDDLTLHRPSLADAFFVLTGRALRDDDA
jgi:ABC-2 type transport system ATP-binding protein